MLPVVSAHCSAGKEKVGNSLPGAAAAYVVLEG